jgi:DNA-binding NarL/FixJ family response regulator
VEDLAARALGQPRGGQPWQIKADGSPSILEVSTYHLDKAAYDLHEDVFLVAMKEESPTEDERALQKLSDRERQVLFLLVHTSSSPKEIAARLRIELGTVRKHVENIHRKLRVCTRVDLMRRFKNLPV